jgi:hypothetical protein
MIRRADSHVSSLYLLTLIRLLATVRDGSELTVDGRRLS